MIDPNSVTKVWYWRKIEGGSFGGFVYTDKDPKENWQGPFYSFSDAKLAAVAYYVPIKAKLTDILSEIRGINKSTAMNENSDNY